ncbi:protein of unknown function [Methylorubrum extorquens]|uniref:Uncharacterized protein n=1 Tax=Methylorubrum extorquens TaxID=408 RepID=A0A2N9AYN4_METEX|nr:protein of unknown function [Methylorubrum extorquens]
MKMRPCRETRTAHEPDHLPLADLSPRLDVRAEAGHVRVCSDYTIRMLDLYTPAVACGPFRQEHRPLTGGENWRA